MKKYLLIFTLIGFSNIPAFAQKQELISKKYTYNTLSSYQKSLLEDVIALDFPKGSELSKTLSDHASIRNITRLAEALLFRNQAGDKENAITILRWLLKYQYQDEKSPYYGMWQTNATNDRKDQNWREFIGCDLIIIYHNYKNTLPKDVVEAIETGLVHAAKGAMKRDVTPYYSNISIMSAFMMEYVGSRFKNDALKNAGLKKARAIFNLQQSNGSFSEYNSPTYYGVTLIGIALWREMAFSEEMKTMGRSLEKALWHETAMLYNANLRNMAGPYFRAYGMDMQKYNAIIGLWMAVALDSENLAPIPGIKGGKNGEMSNLTPIFHLGLSIPKGDLAEFRSFTKPRYVSKIVPSNYTGDTLKKVTHQIEKEWMMGGLWGNLRKWDQIKTGTIHWKAADGSIGWLLVPGNAKTNVKVSQKQMGIYLADASAKAIELFVYSKQATVGDFTDKNWKLPSMDLAISTSLKRSSTEKGKPELVKQFVEDKSDYPFVVRVVYEVPANWDVEKPLLEITPKK
ncbi:hypothetical protein [Persicitalea jodogahamensis]|uniref:Uncharacterized protein n=1 Tax=Persicitalea jodogahamensis TaxID=402147 RepID=A0A8J3D340_9BACT|nr:hypothetical protein [Persicitalea jodogahamensis]GHB65458.1 hypothetical protein GCM10007390_19450 [Persicitalea jodogahamensis]